VTRLPELLRQRAHLTPHRPALVTGNQTLTFDQLDRAVDARAAFLSALGVAPGDRVALLLGNGWPFVELVHAVPRVGATLVPLNTRLTVEELAFQVADSGATLILNDLVNEAKAKALPVPAHPVDALPSEGALPPKRQLVDLDQPHTVIYTSGTTGRPKGAVLTHGNHWWSALGSALNLGLREDDRWLAVLPLFHVGGLSILLRSAIYGIPAVVHESFDAGAANRAIDEGATIVSVVATMLQRMLDERGERPYPAHFRCALLGGGPAPRPLLELAARRGVPVVQTYGLTETASQVATLAPEDALPKLGSAGKPLFPTELRIDAPDADGLGEILVRGPTVTPGYLDQPAPTTHDGWLQTGDLGRLDGDGYLYVVDRRDDLIVSGGENVYPAEVEAALMEHPAVREAGVYGVPDEEWGEAVAAAVALRIGATATDEELRAFVRQRLGGYKVPRAIRFVEALPRNAAGKLLRRELREGRP
jgi:O-succinylbenzoic acid--CoA ligase